jgi:DNA-binding MarR family transcriptional regulator
MIGAEPHAVNPLGAPVRRKILIPDIFVDRLLRYLYNSKQQVPEFLPQREGEANMGYYFEIDALTERFLRIEMLLKRRQLARLRAHGPLGNPMRGQGRVLSILKMQPTISQKQLSYLLDMRQQSLSELLAKLERNGFIERAPSEDDRRVAIITLTDKGRDAAERAESAASEDMGLFDALTEDERAQLAPLLDKVIASLEAEPGEPDFHPPFGPFGPGPFGPGPHGCGHGPCGGHRPMEDCEGHSAFRHRGEGCEGRGRPHHHGNGHDESHGCAGRHGRIDDRAGD